VVSHKFQLGEIVTITPAPSRNLPGGVYKENELHERGARIAS
jgi:hypothetical protein